MEKVCSTCKTSKPYDGFTKNKGRPDGLHPQCKDCRKAYYVNNDVGRKTWEKNKVRMSETAKIWREVRNKDEYNAYMRAWNKKNKNYSNPKLTSYRAKSRASRESATPPWLDTEHQIKINKIFELAKNLKKVTGVKFEVDHIYPIKGETSCGLHVWWNLQVLPMIKNRSKANKLPIEENIIVPRVSKDCCFDYYLSQQFKMYADLYRINKI